MQRSAQLPLSHWALVRLLTQTAVEHTRKAWNAIAPQSEHWVRRVGSSMSICCRWGCAGCLSGFQLGGVGAPAVARHGLSVASTIYLRVQGVGVCAAAHKVMATGEADTRRGQRRARCGTLPSIDVSGGLDGCPRSCVPIEIFWGKIREGEREGASL